MPAIHIKLHHASVPNPMGQWWANSGPRAKCGPPQHFQWPSGSVFKFENSSNLVTYQYLLLFPLEGRALRLMRPSLSGPGAKISAHPCFRPNRFYHQVEFRYIIPSLLITNTQMFLQSRAPL